MTGCVFFCLNWNNLWCVAQIISVTNFEGDERHRVKHMITLIGAKYTGYMTRANSLLVAKQYVHRGVIQSHRSKTSEYVLRDGHALLRELLAFCCCVCHFKWLRGKVKGKGPSLIQHRKLRAAAALALCITDKASCGLSLYTQVCSLASKQPHCCFIVSTLIVLIYRPQRDGRLSWPGWLTHSGRTLCLQSVHMSTIDQAPPTLLYIWIQICTWLLTNTVELL